MTPTPLTNYTDSRRLRRVIQATQTATTAINTLKPRQNGRHFADDIFKCIFLNENVWTSLKISLTFVPNVRINNIPALVQIMAWRRPGDKPLSEPMIVRLPTHICVTRPQWVNDFLAHKGRHSIPLYCIMLSRFSDNKYSLLMHCIKIKSPANFLLNEQYVFVGGNIYFLCVLSCSSEEA